MSLSLVERICCNAKTRRLATLVFMSDKARTLGSQTTSRSVEVSLTRPNWNNEKVPRHTVRMTSMPREYPNFLKMLCCFNHCIFFSLNKFASIPGPHDEGTAVIVNVFLFCQRKSGDH